MFFRPEQAFTPTTPIWNFLPTRPGIHGALLRVGLNLWHWDDPDYAQAPQTMGRLIDLSSHTFNKGNIVIFISNPQKAQSFYKSLINRGPGE